MDAPHTPDEFDAHAARAIRIIESMPGFAWSAGPDGRFIYVSPNTLTYLGTAQIELDPLADVDEFGWRRVVHPDDYDRVADRWRHCLRTGEAYNAEHRLRRADGVYRWFRNFGTPSRDTEGRITEWYGTTIDIEELKQTEEALSERERQLRELIETLPAMIWSTTPSGEPIFFSRQFRDFLGFDVADKDIPGVPRLTGVLNAHIHPDDLDAVNALFARCLVTGNPYALKHRQRGFDGVYKWVETRANAMRNRKGLITQWNGICFDIEDLMRVQSALQANERELSQLVDMVPSHVWRLTPDGEPTFFNKRMVDYLGFDVADTIKPGISRLVVLTKSAIHPDDAEAFADTLDNSLRTGEPFAIKYRLRRTDGVYRWMSSRAEPLRDSSGRIAQWYGLCHDIDDQVSIAEELRLAQERLARSTQAASLAELSASIAHEVNQPLAAIVANSHACHRWLTADPPNIGRAQKTVERVIRDTNSAAEVVGRIRALFKQSAETRHLTAIDSVIDEARELLANEAMRRRIRIEMDIGEYPPLAALDPVQIQQVLVNLMRNGMEAFGDDDSDRTLQVRVRRTIDAIQTEIRDRGRGIEFPDRIFEPFFTTKENGMGMGLAICRSIIESHGGRLWVEKNEPRGAAFIFTLPVGTKAAV